MFIERKYAHLLGNYLEKFSIKSDGETFLAVFRCPYCGDSRKNPYKRRGYFFDSPDKTSIIFKCHNCGKTASFSTFLEYVNPVLYHEYKLEKLKERSENNNNNIIPKVDVNIDKLKYKIEVLEKFTSLLKLPESHPCVEYVKQRQIPQNKWNLLYYTDNFVDAVNSIIPGKFKPKGEDPRLVLPYFSEDGRNVFMLTGRSINPDEKKRYLNVRLVENSPSLYGLERVDKLKDIFVVEGPIDSLFLDNSVAMGSSSVDVSKYLPKQRCIIILDNEPRNPQIVRILEKFIDNGYRVVIWPENILEKDINMMAISGIDYKSIISRNIYSGAKAKLLFTKWRKV